MIRIVFLFIMVIWNLLLFGQCEYNNNTFRIGEHISYKVYYKLGFLWFNAAQAKFNVSDTLVHNTKAYKFTSNGTTKSNYNWIYKVDDHFSSIADFQTLNPHYFHRNTREGNNKINNSYRFNYLDSVIYSNINNNKTKSHTDTLDIQGCTLDVLTAIYACRTLNLQPLKYNDTIPLKMLIDNEFHNLHLRYLGKENTQLENGSEYRCNKFSILLVEGTIFSGGEDLYVWISDDKAKIPIKVEAEILVGTIIAQVDIVMGNKWPLNSCIKIKSEE